MSEHTTFLSTEREQEIRERAAAATPGPWGLYDDGTGRYDIAADLEDTGHGFRCRRQIVQTLDEPIDNDPAHRDWTGEDDDDQILADAEFIAHAREDVPALLAEIDRLRARIAEQGARAYRELVPAAEPKQPPMDPVHILGIAHDESVVAYRNSDRPGVLLCREHGVGWAGLTPLTSDDLPDGGICTWDGCGVDVLITDA